MMAFIAGLCLVFGGMMVGYVLFYSDQSEGEKARRKLTRENEDLRTSLKLAHNSHEKLDERFTRQKGQLNVLQQLCDDWSSNREQSERERAQMEVELSDKARRFEEMLEEVQVEKKLRINLEDENHRLTQEQLESISKLEDQWRIKCTEVESSLVQRQADLKSTMSEKQRLIDQLHASESRVAELQADLANQKGMLQSATTNVSGLRQEYTSLESALAENADLLRQSSSECAAAMSGKRVAEDALAELRSNYQSAQQKIQSLQGKVATLDSLEAQVKSLQEAMANSTEQLEKVSSQRDGALDAEKSALNRASGMQQRIDNQEATIHTLRGKRDEAMNQLKAELQKRNQVETELEEKVASMELRLNEETVQMQNQATTLESRLEMERADWQSRVKAQEHDLGELTKNRDELIKQCEQLQSDVDRLTKAVDAERESWSGRVGAKESELEQVSFRRQELETELALIQEALLARDSEFKLQAEKETKWQQRISEQSVQLNEFGAIREGMKSELAETNQKLAVAETELTDARVELGVLRDQVDELKITCQRILELEKLVKQRDDEEGQVTQELRELRSQYADSFSRQQRLQVELDRVQSEKHQLATEYGAYDNQVELLRNKLKASEETIRNLRRERAGVLARLANYRTIAEPDATVISFTEAMAQRKQQSLTYDKEYGGHLSQHETRGLVYTEAPDTRDDLKRISGIAEVLEGRLNDYGIYTFKQIMEWRPEAIEEFSRLLAFKDRIERDDWLSQARFFYEEKQKLRTRSVAA